MYIGVEFDGRQDVWAGRVELQGRIAYEDFSTTEEGAMLLRELAILSNEWPAMRNLPQASLEEVVRQCASPLLEQGILDDSVWHETIERTGMAPNRFREMAASGRCVHEE